MKRLFTLIAAAMLLAFGAQAVKMKDLKIYINPGHGGYTSNDRPIQIYPFAANDTLGYWESKSNLYKGLHLYHILDSLGAKPYLSRIKNTEADDRSLSGIAAEANSLGVDLFFSIHSNAGEQVNYPLMLYRENEIGTPRYPENITLSKILWKNLHSNQLPVWTRDTEYVCGDLTFYQNMWQGGLGVLRTLYVVGLLSEGSMHEHRPEAHRLMNDDVWWLEAWHFARSIMEYYDTEDRFVTGNVAGVVYDNHNLREKFYPVSFHFHGRDAFAPLNYSLVELLDANGKVVQTRTTDDMWNGVFVFRNVAPGEYTIRAAHDGYYTEEKKVTVTANEVSYQDMPLSLKREFPLEIVKYTPCVEPGELVSCASTIEFDFNTDVDVESFEKAFKIEPSIEGYFEYSNSYTHARFVTELSLEPDITYTVTIGTEARHPDPYYLSPNLKEPLQFSFTTLSRSRLELIDAFPGPGGEVHYMSPTFEFRFDKAIDYSDIYNQILVTDSKGKAVTLNKRTCKFNQLSNGYGNALFAVSGNLTEGETYHVKLSGELRDREQLPLASDAEFDFKAVNVAVEHGGEVIDDIESGAFFEYNPDLTSGIGGTLPRSISSNTALYGKAGAKFTYKFIDNHDGQIVWSYTGQAHQVNEGDVLGFYINGDFNNHELWAGVTAGTDTKWFKLCDMNYLGWQYYEAKTEGLVDGMTYVFSGLKLVQVASPITQNGAFCIDNISLKADSGVADAIIDTDFIVTPNPARGVVTVKCADPVSSLELINAAGQTVATANGSTLDVSAYSAGIYLLRVITDEGRVRVTRLVVE